MFQHDHQIRVRYSETDKMGYLYYGHYAAYFEVARVESLRSIGISYRELEDRGILLPVADYQAKYHRPAFYDDLVTIRTIIPALPKVRIQFNYEVRKEDGELLTTASTTLFFLHRDTRKPMKAPEDVLTSLQKFF